MTAAVFWLAQVYAGVRALGHGERHMPTAILLLGPLGLLEDDTAQDVAIAPAHVRSMTFRR